MLPNDRFLPQKNLLVDFAQDGHLRTIYVLVATTDPTDRQLITQHVQTARARSKLLYCSTASELLECLHTADIEYHNFPHLLVLDLNIAPRAIFWLLLQEIRTSYRLLSLVVIGVEQSEELIKQAYSSGVHSFLCKADSPNEWKKQVDDLTQYWLQTVSLPKHPLIDQQL